MVESYATGLAVLVLLAVAWVGVQSAWRHTFAEDSPDPDALAGRPGCGGGGCLEPCDRGACGEQVEEER
jgi:hypothetical protein